MVVMVKLPDERGAQLRAIARAEGKTMVAVIEDHIRAKIADGVIPADLPGVEIEKRKDGITINADAFGVEISNSEVRPLQIALREMVTAARESKKVRGWIAEDVERSRDHLAKALEAMHGVKVERMGDGIRLVSPVTGATYPVNFNTAEDLADQIGKAAE